MLIAYSAMFSLTLAVVLNAFLKDQTTPKSDLNIWIFVLVTALIWPVTLPFIIRSKLRTKKPRASKQADFPSSLSTAPVTDT